MNTTYNGKCEKHGDFTGRCIEVLGRKIEIGCPKCNEEKREAEELEEKQEKERNEQARIAIGLSLSNIPLRYQSLLTFTPRENQKIKAWDGKKNLSIIGGTGSGKTAYACHLGLKTIYNGDTVRFSEQSEIIAKIKNAWGKGSEQIVQDYIDCDLLIVDEIGRGGYDDYLFRIFNGRYNLSKPTIIIGNVTFKEIPNVLGEAIASRLRGLGVVGLNFGSLDHRESELF